MRFLKWLFTWSGTITRQEYAAAGLILTGLKYLVDTHVADLYGVIWNPWNYFLPNKTMSLFQARMNPMFAALWAIAIPFFWVGIGFTLRRLRAAGKGLGWAVLFFVPVVNLVFFLALCFLPEVAHRDGVSSADEDAYHGIASAAGALLVSAAISFVLVYFSTQGVGLYGGGLFLGVPFFAGFISSALYNWGQPRPVGKSIAMGLAPIGLLGAVLLLVAYEGVICLLMALPLAAPLAMGGALLAHTMLAPRRRPATSTMAAWLFVIPLAMLVEYGAHRQPPVLQVTTSIDINAAPDVVWKNVISFPPLAEPQELIFRSGIAYPTSGEIYGRGVGAVRHCRFSTGEFIEPITVWDEGRLLAFNVNAQPHSMRELSPWKITPPHIENNYMLSRHGQFRFVALSGGRTRLEGTTWYQNYFWPQPYWRLWSDFIVHRIHRRVLEHVKYQAEHARAIGNQ
jgi:uncharacterized membrane protein YhaH (DUF805 family)